MGDVETQIVELRAAIRRQEEALLLLQTEMTELEGEIAEFQARYDQVCRTAHMRLEAVKAAIDDLLQRRHADYMNGSYNPQPSWTPPNGYVSVEEQYRRVWQTPAEASSVPLQENGGKATLKTLYRDLVRRFHPDLIADPDERTRRTEIMRHINEAYAAGDTDTLEALASQIEQVGDVPLATLTVRHLQKTLDGLRRETDSLKRERDVLFYSEMMRLKLDEKIARMRGRDLLKEMAQQMNDEYFQLLERLDELRRK